ncbi:hypothetical protein [Mesorhizobium sp. YR577]|uniref:hypothetical protein n=1 Tax=Mesorhizobium sp. YR577 TaxID=1884373 RepID=UPI001114FF36|nr:hypothetical protein [Mesorhizobium sp. YR577]
MEPRNVTSPRAVFLSLDRIPGLGEIGGWELRSDAHVYSVRLPKKANAPSVWSAAATLSFKMEELGTLEVVSFDIRIGFYWNNAPTARLRDQLPVTETNAAKFRSPPDRH